MKVLCLWDTLYIACVAGVPRGGKVEWRARETRKDQLPPFGAHFDFLQATLYNANSAVHLANKRKILILGKLCDTYDR